MAIGLDTSATGLFSGTGPYTLNFQCSGIQRLLLVVAAGMDNVVTSWNWSGVSFNGASLTQRAVNESAGNNRNVRVAVWTLVNPPAGAAYQVSATPSVGLASAVLGVISLTGVDQTTPTGNTGTDAGQKSGYSTSIVTGIADAWLVGGAGCRNGTLTWSPGTGVSELFDVPTGSSVTDDMAACGVYRPCSAAGSYALAATSSASNYGVLAGVEVRPAATAPAAWFGAEVLEPVAGMWMF
ncbi:MAG: hypothetical protein K1X50_01820 [Candidatus Promineofilum sp.]|nr:hypothetical protein [Promineifilum sp.]